MAPKPGLLVGSAAWEVIQERQASGTPIPTFACCNQAELLSAIEAAGQLPGGVGAIRVGQECAKGFAQHRKKEPESSDEAESPHWPILGAVAIAQLTKILAPAHGACILLKTYTEATSPEFLEGILEMEQEQRAQSGDALFSAHAISLQRTKLMSPDQKQAALKSCERLAQIAAGLFMPFEVLAFADTEDEVKALASAQGMGRLIPSLPQQRVFELRLPPGHPSNDKMIKVAVFSSKSYDQEWLDKMSVAQGGLVQFVHHDVPLSDSTVALATGCYGVCIFVNDDCSGDVLHSLHDLGVQVIALRCAGFNNVDLVTAQELGIKVCRVPAYSPEAVAEHAVALMLSLNRKIPQAWLRTRSGNFSLAGQLGFDMIGKKVGIIGTGQIGMLTAKILKRGFECDVMAYDVHENPAVQGLGIPYETLDEIMTTCDIISLHVPLLPPTKHLVNRERVDKMKKGVMIINTSRGGLVDTRALIYGLKKNIIGAAGLDVYEEESNYFFNDLSGQVIGDDIFSRLLSFANVTLTPHQAFFTKEALDEISKTTVDNILGIKQTGSPPHHRGTLPTLVEPPADAGQRKLCRQNSGGRGASKLHNAELKEIDINPSIAVGEALHADSTSVANPSFAEGAQKVTMFSAKVYDQEFFQEGLLAMGTAPMYFEYHKISLNITTATLAAGSYAVCVFVNDVVNTEVVQKLHELGVKVIALRCAGFNNVDLATAMELGLRVCRVPAYSPDAIAEHAAALILGLNRKLPQVWQRSRTGNFSLVGQLGFDMKGKRVGIIGTGKIGYLTARILKRGFECDVVAYDPYRNPLVEKPEPEGLGIPYMELDEIYQTADIVSLHLPLLPQTKHLINKDSVDKMKPGVMIINTSRGGLIDTRALLGGLKSRKIGSAGLDVYEGEAAYFFEDFSHQVFVDDDLLSRLLSFPNVILSAHQAFFTREALGEIARVTLDNISGFLANGSFPKQNGHLDTEVKPMP